MELAPHHHLPHHQACLWRTLRPPSLAQTLILLSPSPSCPRSLPSPRSYLETPNPLFEFFDKVRGALPVVGLLSRILSDKGGVGGDRIQFKEFCTRVYRAFPPNVPLAFYEFEERHGKVATPQYVLLWCWAAALGAGLLKSEDLMLGAARLRVSFDIQYEEEAFNLLMDEATEKRRSSKSPMPFVPYEARAAKALDAICKCCIGRLTIDERDATLLTLILQAVFPAADKAEVERSVREKVAKIPEDSSIQGSMQAGGELRQAIEDVKHYSRMDPDTLQSEEVKKEQEQSVQGPTRSEEKTKSCV